METLFSKLSNLIDGLEIDDNTSLCDFTLSSQNEAAAAKGITPSSPSDFVPIIRDTVTYIVMAVLLNDKDEVLFMQEAKKSCAGQWYLPAGRMEPGENIMDAVKREVLEETGLFMEPTSLMQVEVASKGWFRFVITGRVTGGVLKTPAQADSESLQAKWVKNTTELSLRASDIKFIIERARAYRTEPHHADILPAIRAHTKLLLRVIVCARQKSSNRIHVLLSEKTEVHFPLCEINHNKNLHQTLRKFMMDIFGAHVPTHKPHGLLNVEHCASGPGRSDGLCLSVLVSFKDPLEGIFPIDKYTWIMVPKDLGEKLVKLTAKNMTISLNVIR